MWQQNVDAAGDTQTYSVDTEGTGSIGHLESTHSGSERVGE